MNVFRIIREIYKRNTTIFTHFHDRFKLYAIHTIPSWRNNKIQFRSFQLVNQLINIFQLNGIHLWNLLLSADSPNLRLIDFTL